MRIGTWNVRSLYRAGSLKAAARELGRYKCDVVGVQEVRWDKGDNDLFSLPNIVRVIKSRRMRWAGYVARMGEERGVYRVLVGKPEGRNQWGDLGVDGWIILEWISKRWDVGIWTGLGWPRIETGGGRL